MICKKYFKLDKESIFPRCCSTHVWPADDNVTLISGVLASGTSRYREIK